MKKNEFKVVDKVRVLDSTNAHVFIHSGKIIKFKTIAIVEDEHGFKYSFDENKFKHMYKIGEKYEAI